MPKQAKKILLIEDDNFLSKVLVERLEDDGFIVNIAGNGAEGIEKTTIFNPDLILLDMILPKMNGFDVLKKLKQDIATKNIPVIIVSNLGQDMDVELGKKLGAVDYLVKSNYSLRSIVEKIYLHL
ncbi:MAG: response regulator [Patescibacteria group bacterium]